jgi:hypothetical protein
MTIRYGTKLELFYNNKARHLNIVYFYKEGSESNDTYLKVLFPPPRWGRVRRVGVKWWLMHNDSPPPPREEGFQGVNGIKQVPFGSDPSKLSR